MILIKHIWENVFFKYISESIFLKNSVCISWYVCSTYIVNLNVWTLEEKILEIPEKTNHRTILKFLYINLNNSFPRDWKWGGGSRTTAICKMDLFVTIVPSCQSLISIVTMNSILNFAVALDLSLYATIPLNSTNSE